MAVYTSSALTDFVAVLAILTVIFYAYYKWAFQYWKRKNVGSLEPSIPFGNLPNRIVTDISDGEHFKILYNKAKAKGLKHCGLYVFASPMWMVLDPELLRHVMAKDFAYFSERGFYYNEKDNPISCHLFAVGGKKWKRLRSKLSPTFTSGKVKMMFNILTKYGAILEKYIEEYIADKQVVNIKKLLDRFSTDIIGSCAFGLEINSFKEPNSPFHIYGRKVVDISALEQIKLAFGITYPNLARKLGLRAVSKDVSDFYTKVVLDTISYREKNNVTRNDFLQILLAMKSNELAHEATDDDGLTINEIIAQSFVFFIAGYETSSTAMTFTLFELALHPEIQEKVKDEIKVVLAKHDNKITYESMNDLVYMQQVVDESLRKYPPLSMLTRQCSEDYKVPGEDLVIQKGTNILIPVTGLHYEKELYKDPEVFDPERFSAENRKNIHQYGYLPFGEGPRLCIGERFGVLETKVALTSILRNFKVSLSEKTKLPLRMEAKLVITSAEGGIWLNIEKE